MKHTFLRRAVPAIFSVSFLGVITLAFAQTVPSPQGSSPAASASSAGAPTQKTVDFLYDQFVKAQLQAGSAGLIYSFNKAVLTDPRVIALARSLADAGDPRAQDVLATVYSLG